MFKINKKIEYAFISLKHMLSKEKGQLTTAKEICELYNIPFDPTARALQILAQKDVLVSEQGVNGGYRLTKELDITLKDLSNMIVGPIQITNCQKKKNSCSNSENCKIIKPITNLNNKINNFFNEIKVCDLLNS